MNPEFNPEGKAMRYIQIGHTPYRRIDSGKPVRGISGLDYADAVAGQGYQIVTADFASNIAIGDLISVGTGHMTAPVADPRPAISSANYGDGLKLVSSTFCAVTRIGRPYEMLIDSVTEDEDHSYGGQRTISMNAILVRRVYFAK
jgi:hypothetical protein